LLDSRRRPGLFEIEGALDVQWVGNNRVCILLVTLGLLCRQSYLDEVWKQIAVNLPTRSAYFLGLDKVVLLPFSSNADTIAVEGFIGGGQEFVAYKAK
jgi:site-specific recombinase